MLGTIATFVPCLALALLIHETAHALALRSVGGKIKRAGLGLPMRPILSIPPRGRRAFALTLSPWLFGAYVEPDDESRELLDHAPYRDSAWFTNAGVFANLLSASVTFTAIQIVYGATIAGYGWHLAAVMTAVTGAIWFGRRYITAYVVPVLALPVLIYIGRGFVRIVLASPASAARIGTVGALQSGAVPSGWSALPGLFVGLSIALAMLNMLPLSALDNGKVIRILVVRFMPRWVVFGYDLLGIWAVSVLLITEVFSDVYAGFIR